MQLSNEALQEFVGGQLEIQNQIEGYIYRGEVAEVGLANDELQVQFKWFAKGDSLPLPTEWTNQDNTPYGVSLITASPSDIGEGRIAINTGFVSNEMLVFYPPDGSKLDPAKVKGLAHA